MSKHISDVYCNRHTAVNQQFGLTLDECARATLSDSQCSGTYFSYTKEICRTSSSCNYQQCKCATDTCSSQGGGDAWDVYRVTAALQLSQYTCTLDTSISGTADVRLSNGKTEDTGYSSSKCESECTSKGACSSFVWKQSDGYV